MISVIRDFDERVLEIEVYFKMLENLTKHDAQLFFPSKKTHKLKEFDDDLIKILKSNCFLLLYNLMESSIQQSLKVVYDTIRSKNIKYGNVIDEIKKIWIAEGYENFKNKGNEEIFNQINNIAEEIISITFDSEKTISGNIDGRKIREFAEKYGFSEKVHYKANNGNQLLKVKTERNNLAHGEESFAECGRRFAFEDLFEIKNEVIIYLRGILKNIKKYLDREKFKK